MKIHAFSTLMCWHEGVRLTSDHTIRAPPSSPGETVVGLS